MTREAAVVGARICSVEDPRERGVISEKRRSGFLEVTTTSDAIFITQRSKLTEDPTVTDEEAARCMRPRSLGEWVQGGIDGTVRIVVAGPDGVGHEVGNRYVTTSGETKKQLVFEQKEGGPPEVRCLTGQSWPVPDGARLDPNIWKPFINKLQKHCGQSGKAKGLTPKQLLHHAAIQKDIDFAATASALHLPTMTGVRNGRGWSLKADPTPENKGYESEEDGWDARIPIPAKSRYKSYEDKAFTGPSKKELGMV